MPEKSDIKELQYYRVLRSLLDSGVLSPQDRYLSVFAGKVDRDVFEALGLPEPMLTNIDGDQADHAMDACALPYEDESFDHVMAHAGLHHASRPHQALCEMYRVARRTVVFVESQDSLLMRLLVRLRLTPAYEWAAILDAGYRRGGVDDRPVPNYIFRWTQREVEKTIRSLAPERQVCIEFYREWTVTWERLMRRLANTPLGRLPSPLLEQATRKTVGIVNRLFGRQGNGFAVVIRKDLMSSQPWIEWEGDTEPRLSRDVTLWRVGAPAGDP